MNGAYSTAGFIFNCSLRFFMVMSALPPFQNNQHVGFCKSGHLSFQRFVFEKVAIIAKWLLCFSKHGKALGWLRFQDLAPNERPNHIEGKDGSVLLHQTQPVVYLLKHNHTPSSSLFPLLLFFHSDVPRPPPVMTALQPNLIKVDCAAALFCTDLLINRLTLWPKSGLTAHVDCMRGARILSSHIGRETFLFSHSDGLTRRVKISRIWVIRVYALSTAHYTLIVEV